MKRFLLSALTLTALSVSSTALASARDPSYAFHPAGGWNTGHMDISIDGHLQQNCFISAEFNNGFFIQISGSADWVDAIDIDFQQEIFEEGSAHTLYLSVPGLNDQAVQATAVSPSTLNVDISGAKNFYRDMRNSSVLDFKLDTNFFRFYMVGLSNQSKDFEKCLAGSTVLEKSGRTPDPVNYEHDEPVPEQEPQREAHLSIDEEYSDIRKTLPTMKLKRTGRRRFTEMIDEQIQHNPAIASVGEVQHVPKVPTQRVPGYYESPLDEPTAPNWDKYEPPASAEPGKLVIPNSYNR